MRNRGFNIDNKVICSESGVIGTVIRFYTPTSCVEQTVVKTGDNKKYHAPTSTWRLYKDGLNPGQIICDELTFSHKELNSASNIIANHYANNRLNILEVNKIIRNMIGLNSISFDFNVINE